VDTTLIHQAANLDYFIGTDADCIDPTVMQLGGSRADELMIATELVRLGIHNLCLNSCYLCECFVDLPHICLPYIHIR
jgi:hypothetical protein